MGNSVFVGIKVPREMAADLRKMARADDRTVSAYIRRLIAAAVADGRSTGSGAAQ